MLGVIGLPSTAVKPVTASRHGVRLTLLVSLLIGGGYVSGCPSTSGTPPVPAAAGLDDVAATFPESSITAVSAPDVLSDQLGLVLAAIVRKSGAADAEVAFVVDRSLPVNAVAALELALAANRDKLLRGRYALVACGQRDGAWFARAEVPLTADAFAVVRGSARIEWTPDRPAIAATWLGLSRASELAWTRGSHPHVVVLTDDRPHPEVIGSGAQPASLEPNVRAGVIAWARERHVAVHALRLTFDAPSRGQASDPQRERGVPLRHLVGLFRDGHHSRIASQSELDAAIEEALSRATPDGAAADVAFVVDRSGLMGEALPALVRAGAAFTRFGSAPQHRLAVIGWGHAPGNASKQREPVIASPLSARAGAAIRAVAALRSGGPGDWPKDLFGALDTARRLAWLPGARKAVVVLTAAPVHGGGAVAAAVLDWAEQVKVSVTVIEPATTIKSPSRPR